MNKRTDWVKVRAVAFGVLAGVVASVGTIAVAVAGFTLSYDAIRAVGVASRMREDWAWLLPVSVDGAMAVGTVAAVVLRRMTGRTAWYPWAVVLVGAGISIACNGLHAVPAVGVRFTIEESEVRFAVSAVPAVMLALSVHLLVTLVEAASTFGTGPSAVTAVDADGADGAGAEPQGDTRQGGAERTPPVDPWVHSTPLSRPSAGPSGATPATVDDRPRRVPTPELDRVWANLGGARVRNFPHLPPAPSAGPSAQVSPNPVHIINEVPDGGDDLLDDARTVAAALARQGVSLSRDNLAAAMRKRGIPVANDRAAALVRQLRTAHGRPDGARTINGHPSNLVAKGN